MSIKNLFSTRQIILVIAIFLIGIFLRFYMLGDVPAGLSNDEVDTGYDAYSILLTGKDQWGEAQPSFSLKGFGDYRPPVYTYLVIPSIATFDLNAFAVRFPAAFIGSLTILLTGVFAYLLWKKSWISVISMFLLSVNPWHVGMSRIGIESTIGLFIFLLALTFFLLGLKSNKILYASIVCFALLIYTYTAYTLFAPLILFSCFVLYRKEITKKKIIILLGIFVLLLLPSVLFGKTAGTRSSQVNLTKDIGTINVVNDQRGECQKALPIVICKVFVNKNSIFALKFVTNYISHFSPELLAINGTSTQYSTLPQRGLLHVFEYCAFIVGVVVLFAKRSIRSSLVLLWIFLSPIPDSLTGGGHYSRFLLALPSIQIAASFGIWFFIERIKKKKLILVIPAAMVLYEVIFFGITYFSYFRIFYSRNSQYGYEETMKYINAEHDKYDRVIVSSRVNDTKQYAYYLFYTKYDPSMYQKNGTREIEKENDNWIRVRRVENIYFLNNIPLKLSLKGTLLIANPKEVSKKANVIREFKDLKGDVLFVAVKANGQLQGEDKLLLQ